MKTKLILLFTICLINLNLSAQKAPELSFEHLVYDFGTIPEETGKISHEFVFKNTGKKDLTLSTVQASCGCTTPKWTKEPIAPKKTGIITVVYSTISRPGYFEKTIEVESNGGSQTLTIKGIVTAKGQEIKKTYPFEFGGVRLQENRIDFRTIVKNEAQRIKFGVYNSQEEEVLLKFDDLPKYVKAKPVKLAAGEKGNIEIELNPAKIKTNEVNDEIKVYFKQKGKQKKETILKIHAKK